MLYPKIGIRPIIDGRWGGVRESLENQTMGMAKSAEKLISETLRYPDGTPVQCVISDTTIGGERKPPPARISFPGKTWWRRSPLRPAGATAPRRSIWTP